MKAVEAVGLLTAACCWCCNWLFCSFWCVSLSAAYRPIVCFIHPAAYLWGFCAWRLVCSRCLPILPLAFSLWDESNGGGLSTSTNTSDFQTPRISRNVKTLLKMTVRILSFQKHKTGKHFTFLPFRGLGFK